MAKRYIVLTIIVGVLVLLSGSLFALWYKGGNELSEAYVSYNPATNTTVQYPYAPVLFYRGIKIPAPEEPVVLFKRYYAISERDPYTGLFTLVMYEEDGHNPFFAYYENGQIAGKGHVKVKTQMPDNQIIHNMDDIKDAAYYDPDGNLVSTIQDGTGTQIFYYPDGTKQWELELDNYLRKSAKMWDKDGTLKFDKVYSKEEAEAITAD